MNLYLNMYVVHVYVDYSSTALGYMYVCLKEEIGL